MNQVPGTVGKTIQEKMNDVLEKNEGFQTLAKISKILTGEETSIVRIPENLSLGDLAYFKIICSYKFRRRGTFFFDV